MGTSMKASVIQCAVGLALLLCAERAFGQQNQPSSTTPQPNSGTNHPSYPTHTGSTGSAGCGYDSVLAACQQARGEWAWTCARGNRDFCGSGTSYDPNARQCVCSSAGSGRSAASCGYGTVWNTQEQLCVLSSQGSGTTGGYTTHINCDEFNQNPSGQPDINGCVNAPGGACHFNDQLQKCESNPNYNPGGTTGGSYTGGGTSPQCDLKMSQQECDTDTRCMWDGADNMCRDSGAGGSYTGGTYSGGSYTGGGTSTQCDQKMSQQECDSAECMWSAGACMPRPNSNTAGGSYTAGAGAGGSYTGGTGGGSYTGGGTTVGGSGGGVTTVGGSGGGVTTVGGTGGSYGGGAYSGGASAGGAPNPPMRL